jgi:hypothetical protein
MAKSKSKKNSSLPPDSVLAEAGAEAQALEGLKLRVDLTLEEKAVLSDQLAQAVENLHNAENDKAEELSQYNADIKAHRASITKLAQQINLGYQMTEVECPVKYNEPKVGQKSVLHPKTGTVLATEAMAEEERQENLFDDENPEARGKKAAENLAEFKGKGKDKTQPATTDAEKAPVN